MPSHAFHDLHSITARGQIGKTSIYYVVYGYQRKRAYAVPNDPQTQAQLDARQHFADGMTYWKAQPQSFRDKYIELVSHNFSRLLPHNLFMRRWIKGDSL